MSQVHVLERPAEILSTVADKAAKIGIQKDELIDAGTAIARRVAKLYADTIVSPSIGGMPPREKNIVHLMTYRGEDASPEVKSAIIGLADIWASERLDTKELSALSSLILLHQDFSHSSGPSNLTQGEWFNIVTDIAMTLKAATIHRQNFSTPGTALHKELTKSLTMLAGHLDDLWS